MTSEVEIQSVIDRETRAWDTKDVDLLLSIFHPDMVWVWPPDNLSHDPMTWVTQLGQFDAIRWRKLYSELFAAFVLSHNVRATKKIVLSPDGGGAFAVVDVDTLWTAPGGNFMHWKGRACKTYSKIHGLWLMIHQTGLLQYN